MNHTFSLQSISTIEIAYEEEPQVLGAPGYNAETEPSACTNPAERTLVHTNFDLFLHGLKRHQGECRKSKRTGITGARICLSASATVE